MKLGIIAAVKEESFKNAAKKGLDFIELCINGGYNTEEFFNQLSEIKGWIKGYNVGVGSVGRWKANVLKEDGSIDEEELEIAYKLIDAASCLGCEVYVCGCNYIESMSYYENCTKAIEFFSKLIEYGKQRKVNIASYNCRKINFVHNPVAWTIIHGHLKELGIKYDPSHAVYNGGDYLKEAEEWGHRFYHVHLKGSLMINGKRVDDPPAGLDQTDWKAFLSILYAKDYSRGLSIEPHSPHWQGELGEKGVDFTISYMKALIL
ncbi:sugar phosphate isomerase/epimerase family protein [Anaerobacterium chartisolvens]|nr:sugar phosphate isomerase/epimerase [Anaerobacterium chartisolvens]